MLLALAGACADGAPVDVVCAGGERYGYDVTLVPLADAATALARAGIVVALDGDDPSAAVALAGWQRPLCTPSTSGANLWLRGLTTYRAWSRADLALALGIARGLPPPVAGVRPAAAWEPLEDVPTTGPPCASSCGSTARPRVRSRPPRWRASVTRRSRSRSSAATPKPPRPRERTARRTC